MILPFEDKIPQIHPTVFLAQGATIIGDVHIGEDSSVWFHSIVRGDVHYIRIGARTNIQDLCVGHVTTATWPLIVGDDVTVGHRAILHGCTVHNGALIGMGAVVMDGAVIGEGAMVAAGAMVPPKTSIPPGSLALGFPAKVKRQLSDEEKKSLKESAAHYVTLAKRHRTSS